MSQQSNTNSERPKNWRELCEAAATEPDPAKLIALIGEINKAFDEMDERGNSSLNNINSGLEANGLKFSSEL